MAEHVLHSCPTCGRSRRVRQRDIGRVKQCRHCHLTQIAPLGYAATRAKHGENFAVRFVRDYRLANPSSLEEIVSNWLDCQGMYFEREYWFEVSDEVYLVDFVLPGYIAIEVQGTCVHQFHTERDRRKQALLREAGLAPIRPCAISRFASAACA